MTMKLTALQSFNIMGIFHPLTHCHIPQDLDLLLSSS